MKAKKDIWFRILLVGLAGIGPFSLNIFKPCLPWIKSDLRAPIETVQLGLSLAVLAAAVATIVFGAVADKYGRKKVVLASLYLYISSSILSAIAPTAIIMVIGRVIQAASSSVALVTSRAIIHDIYGSGKSAPEVARVTFMVVLGVLLAPALGGLIIDQIGWRLVFMLCGLVGCILLFITYSRFSETLSRSADTSKKQDWSAVFQLFKEPVFLALPYYQLFHFAIFFSYTSAAAYIMVDVLGKTASEYGVWFVIAAICAAAGLYSAEKMPSRINSGKVALIGCIIVAIGSGFAAYYLLTPGLTSMRLFIPAAIASYGIGLALPASNAGVMEVNPDLAGTASGLIGFFQFFIAAIFAQLVVQNEAKIMLITAGLLIVGAVTALLFSLLSRNHGVVIDKEE